MAKAYNSDENAKVFKVEKAVPYEGERNAGVMCFDELYIVTKPGKGRGGSSSSVVGSSLLTIYNHDILKNFVNSLKMEPFVVFDCMSLENVYETKVNQESKIVESFDLLYRIGLCRLMGSSHDSFMLIDKSELLGFGMNELVIRDISLDDLKKERRFDSWKDMVRGDIYREVLQAIDSVHVLNSMKRRGIAFREMLNYVIDDSREKDPVLVAIAKASRLPIKFSMRERLQPFNCNAIIFANSGTGKSLAFQRMLGREAPQTISAAGLFGGFTPKGGINPGLLSGEGVMVIDEAGRKTKEENEGEMPILEKALTYTETGEAVRGLVTPISCRGTRSIVIIGNSDLDDSEMNGLERFITKKFTEHANNRVGRRFPIVIYRNNMAQVHKRDFDSILVGKCRMIVDAIITQNRDSIVEYLMKGLRWCSCPDKKFEAYFMEISRRFRSSVLREYTQGVAIASSRVKFAALKIAIFDNMDRIVLTKRGKNELFGAIMIEAKENYRFLVQEIQRSFSGIKESPYDKMVTLIDRKVPVIEIVKATGLSSKTVYTYIDKLGKEPYGRKGSELQK